MGGSIDPSYEFFKEVRQGHVFSVANADTRLGQEKFVVISQTCDVVQPKRPTISLARVVELTGADRASAATGTNPRLVPLPALGERYFGDLCFIESRSKTDFVDLHYEPGIELHDRQVKRDFTLAITRWFGRFPFPDEVVPWLRPLERVVREKYRRDSTLGALLRDVIVEIRIEEGNQWRRSPYRLDVHTIVRAEAMPTLDDGDGLSNTMAEFLRSLRESDDSVKDSRQLADGTAARSGDSG